MVIDSPGLIIDEHNYYSFVANKNFMGSTQYGVFKSCEARGYAQFVSGEYEEEEKDYYIQGNYVDRAVLQPDRLQEFKDYYAADINAKTGDNKGKPLKKYQDCDKWVEAIKAQGALMRLLDSCSDKQRLITWFMFGVWWKGALDACDYNKLVDLKTTKSITKDTWVDSSTPGERGKFMNFIDAFNYYRQMAIYWEGMRQNDMADDNIQVHIVAVEKATKGAVNTEWYYLEAHGRMNEELQDIERAMPRILEVKAGEVKPKRCGRCDYCIKTKVITAPIKLDGWNI